MSTLGNIEPIAREIADGLARRVPDQTEEEIAAWVETHWQVSAALYEAGLIDESGADLRAFDMETGEDAYADFIKRHPEVLPQRS